MTKVNGEINLVVFGNVNNRLLVLHVNSHKLVTNFRCVLSIINQAKLFVCDVVFHFGIVLKLYAFALNFFTPSVLVKALTEKDHISEDGFVVATVDSVTHPVQVQGEYFVNQHFLTVVVGQKIVVSLPF